MYVLVKMIFTYKSKNYAFTIIIIVIIIIIIIIITIIIIIITIITLLTNILKMHYNMLKKCVKSSILLQNIING